MEDYVFLSNGTLLANGNYRIERPLGSGGFGNTYLATDLRMGVLCVVKEFFLKGINDRINNEVTVSISSNRQTFEIQLQKFKKEAQRLFKLNNLHIVRVHAFFDENGTSYYVMDYIDGVSLSALLKQQGQPLTESKVKDILYQVLDALQAVHCQQEPLLHLDIKPGNIMLDQEGHAYLIDFGASKQMGANGGMASTTTGMSYTQGYAPLEQIEQNLSQIGPWTDFYALGATLYRLLTLNHPPSITVLGSPNAFVYPSDVSKEMKSLIKWMMSLQIKDRPQSVAELQSYLEKTRTPKKPVRHQPAPTSSNKVKSWPWLFIIPLGILIGIGSVWMLTHKNPEDKLKEIFVKKIDQWDKGHSLGNEDILYTLYDDKVTFYSEIWPRQKVIESIKELLRKSDGFSQESSDIKILKKSDTSYLCQFNKKVTQSNGFNKDYPSYLRFEKKNGDWWIVEESDDITDSNLRKKRNK